MYVKKYIFIQSICQEQKKNQPFKFFARENGPFCVSNENRIAFMSSCACCINPTIETSFGDSFTWFIFVEFYFVVVVSTDLLTSTSNLPLFIYINEYVRKKKQKRYTHKNNNHSLSSIIKFKHSHHPIPLNFQYIHSQTFSFENWFAHSNTLQHKLIEC